MKSYNSIKDMGYSEVVDRKSRFLGFAKPVESEDAARDFIDSQKKKYHDARHHCFAYRVGLKSEIVRYFDDGEPQGTAGLPILHTILGESLDVRQLVVVVIRYFGGTLLGTGGLVRAYSAACKEAIIQGGVVIYEPFIPCDIEVPYELSGIMEYKIRESDYLLKDITYTEAVTFSLWVPTKKMKNFNDLIADLTSGKGNIITAEELWAYS